MLDPRKILRQLSPALLRELFRRHNQLHAADWPGQDDRPQETPSSHLIYEAWRRLPETARQQIHTVLRDVHELADHAGIKVIAETVRSHHPERAWEFSGCGSRLNRALWFHLQFPELFEQAALFARADSLSAGRYAVRRNGLPRQPLRIEPPVTAALGSALREHYWSHEMRGQHCRVEHYTRSDGNEYFFAYLDDWPDAPLVFADNGDLKPLSARYAFSVLFAFCPADGSLELVAKGGQAVHYPLQRIFCRTVLGIEVQPADPLRPVYNLDVLLDPRFTFPTDPSDRIAHVRLAKIQLSSESASRDVKAVELEFSRHVRQTRALEIVDQSLSSIAMTREQVVVKRAAIQFQFLPWNGGRPSRMTVNIAVPNSCDLREKPEELQVVGERCLKTWEILRA